MPFVAPTDATVLVLGETGTGKELVARAVHAGNRRHARPFVPVSGVALSPGLNPTTLYGKMRKHGINRNGSAWG